MKPRRPKTETATAIACQLASKGGVYTSEAGLIAQVATALGRLSATSLGQLTTLVSLVPDQPTDEPHDDTTRECERCGALIPQNKMMATGDRFHCSQACAHNDLMEALNNND